MKNIIVDNIRTSYFITEDGKCYNSKTNKYLKGQENYKNHYFSYTLTMPDGTKKRCLAHRLVAKAYLIPPSNQHNEVNHKDGDKLNNHVENLEWVTPKENQQHALNLELRKFEHIYCFTPDKKLIAEYRNVAEASKATGLSYSCIFQEVNKTVKALSGGFYWSKSRELGEIKNYIATGRSKTVNQYDLNGKFINSYASLGVAARSLGLKKSTHIGECCRGKIKTYKGFIWKFAEDIVSTSDESQREVSETS